MSVSDAYDKLNGQLDGYIKRDESLARHCTYRIGGPAALYIECDSVADLALTLEVLRDEEVEWTVLGKGSNVLVADQGYEGAVIVLGRDFKKHSFDDGSLTAGAGVGLSALVQEAFSRGLTGMEFAVGIPGTFGGALVMNAGTRDEWMGTVVESVTVFSAEKGLARLRGPEVAWGYRSTNLRDHGVVVEAVLRLQPGDEWRIRATMEASLRRRKRNQPLGSPNAGSVFANPEGESAGRLIEGVGLKGYTVGAAQFSEVHANFIVNLGGARAADVLSLLNMARVMVKEEYGIELRPEIRFLGSFDTA